MSSAQLLKESIVGYSQAHYHDIRALVRSLLLEQDSIAIERHPLGFYKVGLLNHQDFEVRLHAWLEQKERGELSHPHSHTWDLQSIILSGILNQNLYSIIPSPEGTHEVYEIEYSSDGSQRKSTGIRVAVQLKSELTLTTGKTYRMSSSEYHATVVPKEAHTLTLVLAKKQPNAVARVVLPDDLDSSKWFPTTLVERREQQQIVHAIAQAIG